MWICFTEIDNIGHGHVRHLPQGVLPSYIIHIHNNLHDAVVKVCPLNKLPGQLLIRKVVAMIIWVESQQFQATPLGLIKRLDMRLPAGERKINHRNRDNFSSLIDLRF